MCRSQDGADPIKSIDKFKGKEFDQRNINLFSVLAPEQLGFPGSKGSDLWGWTDHKSGHDYALMTLSSGTAFVDVSNVKSPKYIGKLPSETGVSFWRDIKTYKHYAYIVSDQNGRHGVQIFNLKHLRKAKKNSIFKSDSQFKKIHSAHNIAIHAGFAYVVGANKTDGSKSRKLAKGGLIILDLKNPKNPVIAGKFKQDGYTHDTQVVTYLGPDKDHQGKTIALNSNADFFSIVDATDKSKLKRLSKSTYKDSGYIHQGWLTDDHRYFFQNDSKDEHNRPRNNKARTHIWDVNDLDKPEYLGFHKSAEFSTDHNLYIEDDLIYQANYTSGLRVLQINRGGNNRTEIKLKEIAHLDTYPETNEPESHRGAWSAFPFFDDKKIIISDTERGLFLAKLKNFSARVPTISTTNPLDIGENSDQAWTDLLAKTTLLSNH
jgi:choice-of-anchor B domain-containing protein